MFYADRYVKDGHRLITSYGKKEQAVKYGNMGAKSEVRIVEGERYLTIDSKGRGRLGSDGELLCRTLMVNNQAGEPMDGRFRVYGKLNGKWEPTSFRYSTYSAGNAAIKGGLINLFEACALIEEDEEVTPTAQNDNSVEADFGDAPF